MRPAASCDAWRQTLNVNRMTGWIPVGSGLPAPGSRTYRLRSLTTAGAWSLEPGAEKPSLIAPLRRMHVLPDEFLAMKQRGLGQAAELPRGAVREMRVVPQRFSF